MGNIEFIKIYEDEYFFEIECKAYSDKVSVNMNTYVDNNSIDDLIDKIHQFINLKTNEFVWETSKNGNDTTPNFMIKIFYRDSVGHIRIEVYCEINDGATLDKHNCCFYIDGIEAGQLEQFGRRILSLKNPGIGARCNIV